MAKRSEEKNERIERLLMHGEALRQGLVELTTVTALSHASVLSIVEAPPSICDNVHFSENEELPL